jgi:hypothetical protein
MGKTFRQGAGPGDGFAAPHQLEGLLEITRFAEFPLNQAGQGRPFFQGKQGRSREIAGCQITGSWLAQLLVVLTNELVGMPVGLAMQRPVALVIEPSAQ